MGVRPEREMTISRKIRKEKVLEAVEAILQEKLDRLEVQVDGNFNEKQVKSFL